MILTQKVGTQFVHVSTLLLTVAIVTSRQIKGLPSIETSLFTLTPQILKEPIPSVAFYYRQPDTLVSLCKYLKIIQFLKKWII